MQIFVRGIDLSSPQSVPGSAIAYWIDFDSELTAGRALLVPAHGGVQSGQNAWVETAQEAVSHFCILTPEEQRQVQLLPLAELGEFGVTGVVANAIPASEEGHPGIVDIAVGPCWFTLTDDETEGLTVNVGDWVRFVVHGLSFWEEGL